MLRILKDAGSCNGAFRKIYKGLRASRGCLGFFMGCFVSDSRLTKASFTVGLPGGVYKTRREFAREAEARRCYCIQKIRGKVKAPRTSPISENYLPLPSLPYGRGPRETPRFIIASLHVHEALPTLNYTKFVHFPTKFYYAGNLFLYILNFTFTFNKIGNVAKFYELVEK